MKSFGLFPYSGDREELLMPGFEEIGFTVFLSSQAKMNL
jgi:hypothetical protein